MMMMALFACKQVDEGPCVNDPPLTWENFGKGHMRTHCNGCHGSQLRDDQRNDTPVGIDFDTFAGVAQWGERIMIRAVDQRDMPPLGGPTEAELAVFEQWMLCEVIPDAP